MSVRLFTTTFFCFFLLKTAFSQPCQTTTTQVLAPIAVCEGNCAVFNGEVFCNDTTVSAFNFSTCEWSVQQIIIVPNVTVDLGTVAKLSCSSPVATFKGKQFAAPGTYSIWEGCVQNVFSIGTQKDSINLGIVGSVTCSQPVFEFEGELFATPGQFFQEDDCEFRRFTVSDKTVKPAIMNLQRTCEDAEHFHVSFNIFESTPPYFINNTMLGGKFFQSEQMPNGASYLFKIRSQPTGCETIISGQFDCNGLINGPTISSTTGAVRGRNLANRNLSDKPLASVPSEVVETENAVSFFGKQPQIVEIFAPNVLKINALAGNDRFTIFTGGDGFSQIQQLEIIDRNGLSVFLKKDFSSNQPELGWDGRGAQPGVFMWRAAVLIPGGGVENLIGTLTVLP